MNGTSVLHAKRKTLVCAFLAMSENYRKLMVSQRHKDASVLHAQHAHNESAHTLSGFPSAIPTKFLHVLL